MEVVCLHQELPLSNLFVSGYCVCFLFGWHTKLDVVMVDIPLINVESFHPGHLLSDFRPRPIASDNEVELRANGRF